MRDALPVVEQFRSFLPNPLMHKARDTRIFPQDKDVLKFSLTDNGEFSSKAYMNFLRPPGCKRSLAEIVWHSFLPPNVSTFLWKLIRHALPVDIRIATKGIHLASKCRCCKVLEQGTWCIWTRPNAATYKLNIDGSARNGIITGGGIIRDAGGHFVAAFSAFYGHGTITST